VKEIDTVIPINLSKSGMIHKATIEKLKYLFSSEEFKRELKNIREKFNLPAYGIKSYLGVSDKVLATEEKKNCNKFVNEQSLIYDDRDLKRMKLKVKSRKKQYQNVIIQLRKKFNLPLRFQKVLSDWIVLYGKLPEIYSHSVPVTISVYKDGGGKRLFIEIYGDTCPQDIMRAWKDIERTRSRHNIKEGNFLKDYDNYYLGRLIDELHQNNIKDVAVYYKIKNLTGIDNEKLKDEKYVKGLRQKHRAFIKTNR